MKAGLMEIADIFVVNKADRPGADRFVKSLLSVLVLALNEKQQKVPVIKTIAAEKKGIDILLQAISNHQQTETGQTASFLLQAEKAFRLIAQKRMKNVDIKQLAEAIQTQSKEKHFNLYRFIEKF